MSRLHLFAVALGAALTLAGCGSTPATAPANTSVPVPAAAPAATVGSITINDPWIRPASPMGDTNGAMTGTPGTMGNDPGAMTGTPGTMGNDPGAMTGTPGTMAATADPASGDHGGMGVVVNTGGYMQLSNSGTEADYLIAADADISEAVELHTVVMENDVMQMRPVEKIEIAPSGQTELKPGGFHVMFIGLNRELKAGDTVRLSLTFERAGTVEVDAIVRAP